MGAMVFDVDCEVCRVGSKTKVLLDECTQVFAWK
jgi:hypothetical protein